MFSSSQHPLGWLLNSRRLLPALQPPWPAQALERELLLQPKLEPASIKVVKALKDAGRQARAEAAFYKERMEVRTCVRLFCRSGRMHALRSEQLHCAALPRHPCCHVNPAAPSSCPYERRHMPPPSECDNVRLKGQVVEHDVTSQLLAGLRRQLSRSLSCAWPPAARQPASTCDRFSNVN